MDLKANKRLQLENAREIVRIIDRCTHDGRLTERQQNDILHCANVLAELVIAAAEARARGMKV
jgi:hypothetical protein